MPRRRLVNALRYTCKTLFYIKVMRMELVIRKMGNSAGLALPAPLLRELGLSVGQTLRVGRSGDGALTLKPTKTRKKYSAAELNAQCDPRAPMPADLVAWDAMRPVGNEAL